MIYVMLLFTSLIFIALRAFQQLNVQHDRYLWVAPTSLCMAVVEVMTITNVVKSGSLLAAAPLGIGAVLGCWFSMWLHRRMRARKV